MIISDLNYMETAEVKVNGATGSSGSSIFTYYQNSLNLGLTSKLTIGGVYFVGNQADGSSDAVALGDNSYTKTAVEVFATSGMSGSSSWGTAAVSPF